MRGLHFRANPCNAGLSLVAGAVKRFESARRLSFPRPFAGKRKSRRLPRRAIGLVPDSSAEFMPAPPRNRRKTKTGSLELTEVVHDATFRRQLTRVHCQLRHNPLWTAYYTKRYGPPYSQDVYEAAAAT